MRVDKMIESAFAIIGGVIGFLFGGVDGVLITLLTFIALDYISGILVAIRNKTLSSKIGARGIIKKGMILIIISVGHLVDTYIFGTDAVIRNAIIFFYIANEGLSILENASNVGVPIPKKVKSVLIQLKEDND